MTGSGDLDSVLEQYESRLDLSHDANVAGGR